jgi:two-component system cell cycle response regulator DivK
MRHAPPEHTVRFYSRDDEVCDAVADFTRGGLAAGARVVLLATASHWNDVQPRLIAAGINVAASIDRGEIVVYDADDELRQISVDGDVSLRLFRERLAALCAAINAPFHLYGELVNLLAARGDLHVATEIEAAGHELAHLGATVLCTYDLRHLEAAGSRAMVERCHDHAIGTAADGPLILLVDDFEDARDLYRDYLELHNYRVVTAGDGIEAIEQARRYRPAVVFLDIRMPRMSGIDAVRVIKSDPRYAGVPVVALTAHALGSERDAFVAAGFDDVLSKPCLPDTLRDTIETLLGRAQSAPTMIRPN